MAQDSNHPDGFYENCSSGVCCDIANFGIAVSGLKVYLFKFFVQTVTLLSVVFLLFILRKDRDKFIPAYFDFVLFTTLAFFVIVLLHWIPVPDTGAWVDIVNYLSIFNLFLQWVIQVGLVFFMWEKDVGIESEKWTFIRAVAVSLMLSFVSILSTAGGYPNLGLFVSELFLWSFFGVVILLHYGKNYIKTNLADRPAVIPWAIFQCIGHYLFWVQFILGAAGWNDGEAAVCLTVFNDIWYYTLFAVFFYIVARQDSDRWRLKGAHLMAERSMTEFDMNDGYSGPSKNNLKLISYEELEFVELFAEGRHGEVYKAKWRGTFVAVKKLKVLGKTEQMIDKLTQELLSESSILSNLRHPNIVLLLGVTLSPPNYCMILELCPKGGLFHIIHHKKKKKKKSRTKVSGDPTIARLEEQQTLLEKDHTEEDGELPYDWTIMLKIMTDTARGMLFLHSCRPPIIHRDLKSHNLFITNDWTAKVGDFGISREMVSHTMTRVGTPQWMSPEVLREERYTEKADVWAFGVVVWELVTRQVPFRGINPITVISLVAYKGMRLPIPKICPKALRELMQSCMNDDPISRPPFSQILEHLEKLDPVKLKEEVDQLRKERTTQTGSVRREKSRSRRSSKSSATKNFDTATKDFDTAATNAESKLSTNNMANTVVTPALVTFQTVDKSYSIQETNLAPQTRFANRGDYNSHTIGDASDEELQGDGLREEDDHSDDGYEEIRGDEVIIRLPTPEPPNEDGELEDDGNSDSDSEIDNMIEQMQV